MATKLALTQKYTFNVSPSDSYQHYIKPTTSKGEEDRLSKFTKYWKRFFQEFTLNEIHFYLQTELSEPIGETDTNQSSRLHYHGYITFPTVHSLKWFLLYGTVLLSKVCRYTIGPINDPEVWYNYVTKQSFLELPIIEQFHGLPMFYPEAAPELSKKEGVPVVPMSPLVDGSRTKHKKKRTVKKVNK